jgi:transposase
LKSLRLIFENKKSAENPIAGNGLLVHNGAMYLRRHIKKSGGVTYETWTLVETVQTIRGPRQRIVATLGKLPGFDAEEKVGWEEVVRILGGKPKPTPSLFEKTADTPRWATVNLRGLQVERLRHFGDVYLGLVLWHRLGLAQFCKEQIPEGREEIPWSVIAAVLAIARFCAPSSELQIAESWYAKTALDDLIGVPAEKINDDRLYRALDALLPHKDALCRHLQKRYGELFGTSFDFLIYDVTSTYFEGSGKHNDKAKRGYSRDGRPDCLQVCIGLVTSAEGLPIAYEVFDGNRVDVTTVDDIVELMETKYGKARRVWVMDRGMVSEENLETLRAKGAHYIVGTPKAMLRKFEWELLEAGWEEVAPGVEAKLCAAPDGSNEVFLLCRSEGRQEKEQAILNRFVARLESGLVKLQEQAARGRLRDKEKALLRIGRLLERNSRAASLFDVAVEEQRSTSGPQLAVTIKKQESRADWAQKTSGSYLLRTNWEGRDPRELWKLFIQLTQAEDAFRTAKTDLGLRPIFHQTTERTDAHILVCFLALAMWRTLQQWMECAGLGSAPRKLVEEMREIRAVDVMLPARDKTIRVRTVPKAPQPLRILLQRLGLPIPNQSKVIENVVQKMAV